MAKPVRLTIEELGASSPIPPTFTLVITGNSDIVMQRLPLSGQIDPSATIYADKVEKGKRHTQWVVAKNGQTPQHFTKWGDVRKAAGAA